MGLGEKVEPGCGRRGWRPILAEYQNTCTSPTALPCTPALCLSQVCLGCRPPGAIKVSLSVPTQDVLLDEGRDQPLSNGKCDLDSLINLNMLLGSQRKNIMKKEFN